MIRRLGAAVAFAVIAPLATPATAADIATLGCVRDNAGAVVVGKLMDQLTTGFNTMALRDVDPDWSPVMAAAVAYRDANGWSEPATRIAGMITAAAITRDVTTRLIPQRGGDLTVITGFIARCRSRLDGT